MARSFYFAIAQKVVKGITSTKTTMINKHNGSEEKVKHMFTYNPQPPNKQKKKQEEIKRNKNYTTGVKF